MREHVAIVGSREYPDLEAVMAYVNTLPLGTTLISGGAREVDAHAEGTARAQGLSVISYRPTKIPSPRLKQWRILRLTLSPGMPPAAQFIDIGFSSFGQAAFLRNGLIVDACTRLVAFWDGQSKGTGNSIHLAEKAGKPVEIHHP